LHGFLKPQIFFVISNVMSHIRQIFFFVTMVVGVCSASCVCSFLQFRLR